MRRRKADSLEVQQMKAQAREEKARKQVSKAMFGLLLPPGSLGLGGKESSRADQSPLVMDDAYSYFISFGSFLADAQLVGCQLWN